MSVESAKAFLKRFAKDEDFRKSLENASNDEERRNIVKEAGFQFTKDDLKALAKEVKSELSEKELEKVAGGSTPTWTEIYLDAAGALVQAGAVVAIAAM